MPKSENQKLKMLFIAKFLMENTDENHCVTTNDIVDMLRSNGISAERKSIYDDIAALKSTGMDIVNTKGRGGGTRLLSRNFELAELKLLVDAVQASRFITAKKSMSLISKLGSLTSMYDRKELQRDIFISNRVKSDNESVYYNTDVIFNAINGDRRVSFKYFNYDPTKNKAYHNDGLPIVVSPFALQYDSEKYYMIAFDSAAGIIKHYRVDKMERVNVTEEERDGKEIFEKFDLASYASVVTTMYGGEVANITISCPGELAGAVIDKFGKGCKFFPLENGEYSVCVDAALSPTFYAWVFNFGGDIKITAPQNAVDDYILQLKKALKAQETCF